MLLIPPRSYLISGIMAITIEAIREAAELLGIREKSSLNEIRSRYHEMIKEWHPDVSKNDPGDAHTMTIRLKDAYDILINYAMNYPISFRTEDLAEELGQIPADYWTRRFGNDPIWN